MTAYGKVIGVGRLRRREAIVTKLEGDRSSLAIHRVVIGWSTGRGTIYRVRTPAETIAAASDTIRFVETPRATPSVKIDLVQDNVQPSPKITKLFCERIQSMKAGSTGSTGLTLRAVPEPTDSVPGSGVLGIWRLGACLHAGPRSQHWAAQPADARGNPRWDYVVRTLPKQPGDREAARAGLRRFAEAAALAQDRHLVCVTDAACEGNEPFLVMPRLTGRTLNEALAANYRPPLAVALWWVRQAAQAAAALHRAGLMHGDIRPETAWVAPDGTLTLLDLSSAVPLTDPAGVSEPSPTTADDLAALGHLLWNLLAYTCDRSAQTARLEPVADLIAETLAPDPHARPTATQLVERLECLELVYLGRHIRPEWGSAVTEPTELRPAA